MRRVWILLGLLVAGGVSQAEQLPLRLRSSGQSAPLAIVPASLPSATAGAPYSGATLTATGGTAPYTFTAGALGPGPCTGLVIDPAGALSGTPTTAGICSWSQHVVDDADGTDSETFAILVVSDEADTTDPTCTMTAPAAGAQASASIIVSVSCDDDTGIVSASWVNIANGVGLCTLGPLDDVTPPYTRTLQCGLSLVGGGVENVVTITALDLAGNSDEVERTFTFVADLSIAAPTSFSCTVGMPIDRQLFATGGISPVTFALQSGAFPAGDPSFALTPEGRLTGTPASCTCSFTIRATDAASPTPDTADRAYTCSETSSDRNGYYTALTGHESFAAGWTLRDQAQLDLYGNGESMNIYASTAAANTVITLVNTNPRTVTCAAGTPVICTTTGGHNGDTGQAMLVYGTDNPAINGQWTITKISGTQLALNGSSDPTGSTGGMIARLRLHGCSAGKRVFISGHSVAAVNGTYTLGADTYVDAFRLRLPVEGTGSTPTSTQVKDGSIRCESWRYDPGGDIHYGVDGARVWLSKDRVDLPSANDQIFLPIQRNTGTFLVTVDTWLSPESATTMPPPGRFKFLNLRHSAAAGGATPSGGKIWFEPRLDFERARNQGDPSSVAARIDLRTYELSGNEKKRFKVFGDQPFSPLRVGSPANTCPGDYETAGFKAPVSTWIRWWLAWEFRVLGPDFAEWIDCTGVVPGAAIISGSTTTDGITTVTASGVQTSNEGTGHLYAKGYEIRISESADTALNGDWIVQSATATTFTVACGACGTGGAAIAHRYFDQGSLLVATETEGPVRINWKIPVARDMAQSYVQTLNLELDTSATAPEGGRPADWTAYFANAALLVGWTLDDSDTDVFQRPHP